MLGSAKEQVDRERLKPGHPERKEYAELTEGRGRKKGHRGRMDHWIEEEGARGEGTAARSSKQKEAAL